MNAHTPVLLQQVIEALAVSPGRRFIDATVGEGGHLRGIVEAGGTVLAIDWDDSQIAHLKQEFKGNKHIMLERANFSRIKEVAQTYGFDQIDGVLFDLGLSMRQLNSGERGFSYKRHSEPLDMRIGEHNEGTAAEILNTYSEKELYELFGKYAEDMNSLEMSRAIVRARKDRKIKVVGEFIDILHRVVGNNQKTYARVFQALRIAVNDEFTNLKRGLMGAVEVVKKGGRIAVISFHSREDRIVKLFIKERGLEQISITKGYKDVSYERSAVLRVFTTV